MMICQGFFFRFNKYIPVFTAENAAVFGYPYDLNSAGHVLLSFF